MGDMLSLIEKAEKAFGKRGIYNMRKETLLEMIGNIDNELLEKEAQTCQKQSRPAIWRKLGAVAACIAVIFSCAAFTYAASPSFRDFINLKFFKDNSRITEPSDIPEGYIAIYTKEQLNDVRKDLFADYILMADISFTDADFAEGGAFAGGWVPIGNAKEPFYGVFNGNGHTVSGLRITNWEYDDGNPQKGNSGSNYVGLFGLCSYKHADIQEDGTLIKENYSIIKNLRVCDMVIDISVASAEKRLLMDVGAVAGEAFIVAGCSAEDVKINLNIEKGKANRIAAIVGGVCGEVYIMDSCYSNAEVRLSGTTEGIDPKKLESVCNAGVLAGKAFALVTSYADGKAEATFPESTSSATVADFNVVPKVLTADEIDLVVDSMPNKGLNDKGELGYFRMKLEFKYYEGPLGVEEACFVTDKNVDTDKWRVMSGDVSDLEHEELVWIIDNAYGYERFIEKLREIGYKIGNVDSYSAPEEEFKGFDFENIWYREEGKTPELRIFLKDIPKAPAESTQDPSAAITTSAPAVTDNVTEEKG